MRRTLPVLILVVAVAAGLWLWLAESDRSTGTQEESTPSSGGTPSITGPTAESDPAPVTTTPDADQGAGTATESAAGPSTEQVEQVPDAAPSTTAAASTGSDSLADTTPAADEALSDSGAAPSVPASEPAAVAAESVAGATPSTMAAPETAPLPPLPGDQTPPADGAEIASTTETAPVSPPPGEPTPPVAAAEIPSTTETASASTPVAPVPDPGPPTIAETETAAVTSPDGSASQSLPPSAAESTGVPATVKRIVESLAEILPLPAPAEQADESVTQEQISSVVPEDVIGQVSVREPAADEVIETRKPVSAVDEGEPTAHDPLTVALVSDAAPATVPEAETGSGDEVIGTKKPVSVVDEGEPTAHDPSTVTLVSDAAPATVPEAGTGSGEARSVPMPEADVSKITANETPAGHATSDSVTDLPAVTAARTEPVPGPSDAADREPPPPGGTATGLAGITEKVEELVTSLVELVPMPAPANRADESVTQEQISSLIPEDVVGRVSVREPAGGGPVDPERLTSVAGDGEQPEGSESSAAPASETVQTVVSGAAGEPAEAPDSAPPAGTVADSSGIREKVEQFVERLAKLPPRPDPAEGSDDSVEREQVASAAPDEAIERVAVRDGTGDEVTDAPPVVSTTAADDIEAEAERFVETMTEPAPLPIPADRADHFVTQEQVISLVPEDLIERVTVGELKDDRGMAEDTPITVVRESEQVETVTPERLVLESGGDVETPVRVAPSGSGDRIEQTTVREVLESALSEPGRLIPVVKTVRHFEVTTLGELLDKEGDLDALLQVITRPYRIEVATLADLLRKQMSEDPDSIFYLHTVQPTDEQGIWGIVHFGIIDKFAAGIALRRGDDVAKYTVRIPRDADERLPDQSSSFLGKMIDRKTKESFVYNFREHRIGRNPDRIFPGQELVIINFKQDELTAIYEHFATS